MPSRTVASYIIVALFGALLFCNYYAFAAPIPTPWESHCSASAVLAQEGLDQFEQDPAAQDLHHPGPASFSRSSFPCQHRQEDGAAALEVPVRTSQQEDRTDLRLLPLGLCTHAPRVALGPVFLATMGSTPTSEATESQQCKICHFESSRSLQPLLPDRWFRSCRWSSSLCRQPAPQPAQEEQPQATKSPQKAKVVGKGRGRRTTALFGASLVFQSAQIAISAGLDPSYSGDIVSRGTAQDFDRTAAQVSGSTFNGDPSVPHLFDGASYAFYCEVAPQLGDQAGEGPKCPYGSTGRQIATAHQVEKFCDRCCSTMESINRGFQEGRPDSRGADSGSQGGVGGHQGAVRPDSDAAGRCWQRFYRNLGRGGEQDGRSIRKDFRWAAADDGLSEQSQGHGRPNGGGTTKSLQAATFGSCGLGRGAFLRARQGEALGSACQGRQLGTSEAVVAYWSHSVCDEPYFKSVWAARLDGLQAAFDLGLSTHAPLKHTLQRCGKRSGPRKVSFSTTIRLQFCAADSMLSASMDISEEVLCNWPTKPWSLRQRSISTSTTSKPSLQGDSFSHGVEAYNRFDDEGSFVQAHAIKRLRNEFQPPDLPDFVQRDERGDADPHDDLSERSSSSYSEHSDLHPDLPGNDDGAHPHDEVAVRTVLLYWRDNPAIHAQISSSNTESQLSEIAEHLGFERHDLVHVYRVNVDLPHIPDHITPLLVHHLDDFVPGEAVCLCLVDVEIHGNRHERHYASFPAIDRRVVIMPQRLTRRLILEFYLTLPYCQRVQHRCLVNVNDKPIHLQDQDPFWASHGDYIIRVPPDEECDDTTSYLMQDALREARQLQTESQPATPQDGYSPSLVPSEDLRNEFGPPELDGVSFMQTASPVALPLIDISSKILNANDVDLPLDSKACISTGRDLTLQTQNLNEPPLQRFSWTEEFLQAMGALRTAEEDMPEFPAEQNIPMAELPSWVQELWPIWQQFARPGPGAVEYMARVETWYTDHRRVQHCLSSRIVILGADPSAWVNDILAAWRDFVLPGFDIQITAVLPMTDDQAPNICAQLLLIQRPDPFSRSIIVTISDTAVQRGLPQSCAIVAVDHVRIHSVLLMTGLLYQCPPEILTNRCRLYYGTRELRGEAYIPAAHGDVFNLIIQRDVTVDIHSLMGLPDPQLRQRLAVLLDRGIHYLHVQDGERPDLPAVLAPDWFSQLEQAFDVHAASELLEEGPVFYIHTWFLDALTATRCPVSRPVRLLQDRRTWRSALIAVWQDQIQVHQPIDFAFVDPEPPRLPWMSPSAHLLLTQRGDPIHASVLISAVTHQDDDPALLQAMHYTSRKGFLELIFLMRIWLVVCKGQLEFEEGPMYSQPFKQFRLAMVTALRLT